MLTAFLLLLYLDARRTALAIAALFVACNLLFTQLTIWSNLGVDGAGYLIAGSIGALVALVALWNRLRRLEYLTFMLQPMAGAG